MCGWNQVYGPERMDHILSVACWVRRCLESRGPDASRVLGPFGVAVELYLAP